MDEQTLRRLVDSRIEWRERELMAKIEAATKRLKEMQRVVSQDVPSTIRAALA